MKRTAAICVALVLSLVSSVYAIFTVTDTGTWPKSWPAELEPLRKQSRTFEGPKQPLMHYAIPFTKRDEFESAWPHLLKIKSNGAPIVLRRGPSFWLGDKATAGVCVHTPPAGQDPIADGKDAKGNWEKTISIELIVDGAIIDLNRIPLPADTPIIDERFKNGAIDETPVAKNKAEDLFRQMEQACVHAKSANVAFSGKFQGATDGELKGSLLLATGNKFRLEMKGDLALGTDGIQPVPVNVAMVCDGKQSRTASLDPQIPSQVVDVTNNYDTEMRLKLARAGILGPMFMLAENVPPGEKPREFDAEKQLGLSDFQLGENQIIGEQQALTIHHKLHNRNYTEPLMVTVWLDAKTKLPLKREITTKQDQRAITLTETYPTLTLDEKVDDQQFELPKP